MRNPLTSSIAGAQPWMTEGFLAGVALAPEGSGPPGRRERALRIVVVEDDYFTAVQNQTALGEAGYEVVGMAGSFEEAVRMAEAGRPDLMVMDIRLAGTRDGVDAAREIMERFGIPSLFVSAYTDEATRGRAAPAQPLGWLPSPSPSSSSSRACGWRRSGFRDQSSSRPAQVKPGAPAPLAGHARPRW